MALALLARLHRAPFLPDFDLDRAPTPKIRGPAGCSSE